jgi:spore photoproduct lyase
MKPFMPARVYFEPEALDYPLGQRLYQRFAQENIPITMTASHNRVTGIPGDTPLRAYQEAKRTLVIGLKKSMKLDVCKPSANFEFALGTSCPGGCQYCYLQTTLGKKPYVRVYVNIDEILEHLAKVIAERAPAITTFEAASTSDPVAVEHLTGSLRRAIDFFGGQPLGRMRVVTKFPHIDSLLAADHKGHTRFRFSVNSRYVIEHFEGQTAPFDERIEAAGKIYNAGYPLGFIVAPIMIYDGWEREYDELFAKLAQTIGRTTVNDLTFELITYRFTARAKHIILERFPKTKLDMDERKRRIKWGPYGYNKFVYQPPDFEALKNFMTDTIGYYFPSATIDYFT